MPSGLESFLQCFDLVVCGDADCLEGFGCCVGLLLAIPAGCCREDDVSERCACTHWALRAAPNNRLSDLRSKLLLSVVAQDLFETLLVPGVYDLVCSAIE